MNTPASIKVALSGASNIAPVAGTTHAATGHFVSTDWFDPTPYLGERGYKYHTAASRMLASAMVGLEAHFPESAKRSTVGVIVGTNYGNTDVLAGFGQTIARDGAAALPPMEAPNFSVNVPASQVSIRYGLHAFNITLTQDTRAGLDALVEAARAIEGGRATAVAAGAVEPTLPLACLPSAAPDLTAHLGACMFMLRAVCAGVPTSSQLLRSRRAGCLDAEGLQERVLAPLTDGLTPPDRIVLCSPPGVPQDMPAIGRALRAFWPRAQQISASALSSLSALRALQDLAQTPGLHLLVCWDRHGAVTGVVVETTATV